MNQRPDIVVVDASLALKWTLAEPDSATALALLERWTEDGVQPIVPSWFACEIANVLYQYVRRRELDLPTAQAQLDALLRLVDAEHDAPADATRAMEIADLAGTPASYDAQYAALAERLGCELWTADDRFRDAVRTIFPRIRSLSEL